MKIKKASVNYPLKLQNRNYFISFCGSVLVNSIVPLVDKLSNKEFFKIMSKIKLLLLQRLASKHSKLQ